MKAIHSQFKGIKELEKKLEETLGQKKTKSITIKALNIAARKVESKLRTDMLVFKDTGYSIEEIVRTNAGYSNFVAMAKIGWNGPHQRYRLIHLNEWGYNWHGRQIKPKGFGVIEKSLKNAERDYFAIVEEELRKWL